MLRSITVLLVGGILASLAFAGTLSGPAPSFTLESRGGDPVTLSDFKGNVVMINFWASWCVPCRQEMPHLEALHQRYGSLGFTLLGVNVEDNPEGSAKFLAETPVTFPILWDRKNEVSKLYDVVAMPTTVLVGRDGTLRFVHHAYKPGYENEYQTQIRALLRE